MANITNSLNELMKCDGIMGCCIADYTSGMALGKVGGGVDLELAAAGNSEVVKAKMDTMRSLNIKGEIEDILITLTHQIHIIRPSKEHEGLYIYMVLDKSKSNLALARRKAKSIEEDLSV